MNNSDQLDVCRRWDAAFEPSNQNQKIGISQSAMEGAYPLNGLRHPPEGETTGWFIWAGEEPSDEHDFFEPMHVRHLDDVRPEIRKYLGLAPGWRFLIAPHYEDVWYDESLLKID